jgi:hypothetical protein
MATLFGDRSYRASRKERASWSFHSVPLFVVGLLLVLLAVGSACVDIFPGIGISAIPVTGSPVWASSGVWIFIAMCSGFLAFVCIDLSKPKRTVK